MCIRDRPDIEQLIRADFVALLADAIDTAAINGSGSSNQPTGILNTSGIGSVAGGTNGLAPTLDHLLDLKKEVAVDNADVASCGYLTNAKVEAVLAKAKDSQSQYLLSPYGAELGRSQIAWRRFEVSNNVPSNLTKGTGSNLSAVIYGNFADLLIDLYGTLEILVDPYTDFAKGTTGIRGTAVDRHRCASRRIIRSDAGRNRITATTPCLWCVLARGLDTPGFLFFRRKYQLRLFLEGYRMLRCICINYRSKWRPAIFTSEMEK